MNLVKFLFLISFLGPSLNGTATEVISGKQKIIYKYKKYEKFDFDDLTVDGEVGSPGDLSIAPRYQRKFKNRLPYRKNFNPEIKMALDRVR